MHLQEVGCGYVDWIGLAQDRDKVADACERLTVCVIAYAVDDWPVINSIRYDTHIQALSEQR
jgi:hypothetical protein